MRFSEDTMYESLLVLNIEKLCRINNKAVNTGRFNSFGLAYTGFEFDGSD